MEDLNLKQRIGRLLVSTVSIEGLEYKYETMVFKGNEGVKASNYTTESEARTGHKRIVKEVKIDPEKYVRYPLPFPFFVSQFIQTNL